MKYVRSSEDGVGEFTEDPIDLDGVPQELVAADAVLDVDPVHLSQVLLEALLATRVHCAGVFPLAEQCRILQLEPLQTLVVAVTLAVQGLKLHAKLSEHTVGEFLVLKEQVLQVGQLFGVPAFLDELLQGG